MGWQQIVMIIWLSACVGIGLIQHGKPKQGYYSFWNDIISAGIMAYILWSGGFWN